jgi:hypothetical protein
MASYVTSKTYPNPWPKEGEPKYSETEEPVAALASAMSYWGNPLLSSESTECLTLFSETCPVGTSKTKWELSPYRAMRQNALRMLIATSPDMQVS